MEGAPHTAKRTIDVSLGCPPPPYIKEWRRGGPALSRRAQGGIPTPGGSRIPPSLVGVGEEGRGEGEKERKGGLAPLPIRIGLGGHPLLCFFSLLSTKAQ